MHPAPQPPPPPQRVELKIPFTTVLSLAASVGLLVSLWLLRPFLAVLVMSLLCAVTLHPLLQALQRRGLSRGVSVVALGTGLVGSIVGFWALILPPLTRQVSTFTSHLHEVRQGLETRSGSGFAHTVLEQALAFPRSPEAHELFKHKWTWGLAVVDGVSGLVLLLILTLYLLVDGKRLYAWLLSYVPRKFRERVAATVPEVASVVRAYVRGQVITSVVCGLYAWGGLTLLHVPAALPLAVIAGLFDVLPVLGFVLAVVPAALLALTVSPATALGTVGLYVLYHALENYLLVPRIYGKQLRLSTVTVLVSIIVGGTLGGVVGAILVLPFVAAYPIIERMWLGNFIGEEALQDHTALDSPHDHLAEHAAEKIIEGQRPPGSENPDAPRH